jgi:hypothetical protein
VLERPEPEAKSSSCSDGPELAVPSPASVGVFGRLDTHVLVGAGGGYSGLASAVGSIGGGGTSGMGSVRPQTRHRPVRAVDSDSNYGITNTGAPIGAAGPSPDPKRRKVT